jgi:LuxR family maltose regulon positive regulatory protein
VFAIQLAGLYLKNLSVEGYGVHILHSNIYRLIDSEIIAQISGELRRFLIKLSLIGEASPELVRELAHLHLQKHGTGKKTKTADDGKKVESLLRQIEGIGSLIRFDAYRNVFSIHRLFHDYLSETLDELTDGEKREVYLAAADWCADHGLKMDAINYYEKAGNYGKLIAQINTLPLILPGRMVKLLIDALDRIPKGVFSKYTGAYLLQARFLLNEGRLNEAREKIESTIKSYETLPKTKSTCYVLFTCYYNLGLVYKLLAPLSGDYSFPSCFEKCHHYQVKWGETVEGPRTSIILGTYACRVGSADPADMERYLAAMDASVPHVVAAMNGCMYGLDDLCWGEFEFFRTNLEAAESHLREAQAKAREHHQYNIEIRSCFYLMRIGIFLGDIDLIKECHKSITACLENEQFINRYIYHDIYRGWFYTHLGDVEETSGWLRKETEEVRYNGAVDGLELLIKAKICLKEKNYPGVLFALRQTSNNAGLFVMGKVEIYVLEALCWYQTGDKVAAYEALEKARLFAEPNGFYAPFTEKGKDIRALATQALKDRVAIPEAFLVKIRNLSATYAKKYFLVAEYFSAKSEYSPFSQPEGLVLSRRERDVLTALFQGLTQDEIAVFLSKSVNTVKSVIRRIYEKLGAANRADAIRIAMSRGLLEWESEQTQKQAAENTIRPLLRKATEGE